MHTATYIGGDKVLIYGGFNGEEPYGDLWLLHASPLMRWEAVQASGPTVSPHPSPNRSRPPALIVTLTLI